MKTLLIADDVDVSRKQLSNIMSRHGYRVLEAEDGDEALEIMHSERPDLAIIDLFMPAKDGFEFVWAVRNDPAIAPTPVIFFSSTFAADDVRALASSLGVRQLLRKTTCVAEILEAIRDAESGVSPSSKSLTNQEFYKEHSRLISEKLIEHIDGFVAAFGGYAGLEIRPQDSSSSI